MDKLFGYELFSSLEEFKIQMALGSVDRGVLYDIADDEHCPNAFKDHLIEVCEDNNVLYYVAKGYHLITDVQMKTLLDRALSNPKSMAGENLLEGIVENRSLSLPLTLEVLELTSSDPDRWSEIDLSLMNNTDHLIAVAKVIVKRSYNASSVLERALWLLWQNKQLSLKEE